jgi:hypothetical protein
MGRNEGDIDNLQIDEYKQDLHISRPSSPDGASSWSRCHISKIFFDGKQRKVTSDYAMTEVNGITHSESHQGNI